MKTDESDVNETRATVALVALTVAAIAYWNAMPILIGGFVDEFGWSPQLAGRISSLQLFATMSMLCVATMTVHRWNLRRTVLFAACLFVLSDFCAAWFDSVTLMILTRIVSGLAAGVILGAVYAAISRVRQPTRVYGIVVASMSLSGLVWFLGILGADRRQLRAECAGRRCRPVTGGCLRHARGALAAWMDGKVGDATALVAGLAVMGAGFVTALYYNPVAYVAATVIWNVTHSVVLTFFLGLFAKADASGRLVNAGNLLWYAGGAVGPAAASLVLVAGNYSPMIYACSFGVLASLVVIVPVLVKSAAANPRY